MCLAIISTFMWKLKGGKAIGRFKMGDRHYGASSAIAQLQKGIEVYLKVTSVSSGLIFREDSHGMNTFSDHLLNN